MGEFYYFLQCLLYLNSICKCLGMLNPRNCGGKCFVNKIYFNIIHVASDLERKKNIKESKRRFKKKTHNQISSCADKRLYGKKKVFFFFNEVHLYCTEHIYKCNIYLSIALALSLALHIGQTKKGKVAERQGMKCHLWQRTPPLYIHILVPASSQSAYFDKNNNNERLRHPVFSPFFFVEICRDERKAFTCMHVIRNEIRNYNIMRFCVAP